MAAANIDAVERYVKRIDEYAEDKLNQTKLYKPTVKRIYKIRNMLLKVCDKLDKVLAKFGHEIEEVDTILNSTTSEKSTSVAPTVMQPNDIDIDYDKLASVIGTIVDAKLSSCGVVCAEALKPVEGVPNDNDSTSNTSKSSNKSINNKKIVAAYKQMFEESKQVNHESEIVQRTLSFLRDWFDTKIIGFYKLQKVNPKLTYNITWLPKWIRDYIVYIGSNADNIEDAFDKLEDFLYANENDSRYTYIVPYEVAELGRNPDRMNVTDVSSAIWGELFSYVFKNLAIPNDHTCYCAESLIDYAYLTDKQIENFVDAPTPEYYKTVEWVMKFKFKLE